MADKLVEAGKNAASNFVSTATAATVVGGLAGAYSKSGNAVINSIVDNWLSTTITYPPAHIATILSSSISTGNINYGGIAPANLLSRTIASPEFLVRAAEIINTVTDLLSNPNIEGIPIFASNETMTHHADVAESQVLLQGENQRRYATENIVPHPREWTVTGYLRTISSADQFFNIKPSVQLQVSILEAYMESRRPCWYKTNDCRFYKVNIVDIRLDHKPENGHTAVAVSLQLKEFNPLMLDDKMTGTITSQLVDAADVANL